MKYSAPGTAGAVPTGTGFVKVVGGVQQGAAAYPTKSDVGLSNCDNTSDADKPISTATQTALNTKGDANYLPRLQSVTSAATVTPTFSNDIVIITAQALGLTLAAPTGTAVPNAGLVIRIKDDGTARAITYNAIYRAIGVTLPSTTVINKTLYLGMIYNATDTKWDVVSVAQEA